MKVLLDTHTFLWWIADDPQLSPQACEIIGDGENKVFVSAASGWEMAIKAGVRPFGLDNDNKRQPVF